MARLAALLLLVVPLVDCYPRHVPQSQCSSMEPNHGNATAMTTSPPYKILLGKHPEDANDVVVRIIADPKIKVFEGFYIQARDENNNTVGMFHDEQNAQTQTCMGKDKSAAHHTSKGKKKFIDLRWTPDETAGNIHFKATTLRSFKTFWMNVMSEEFTTGTIPDLQTLPEVNSTVPGNGMGEDDGDESHEDGSDESSEGESDESSEEDSHE